MKPETAQKILKTIKIASITIPIAMAITGTILPLGGSPIRDDTLPG